MSSMESASGWKGFSVLLAGRLAERVVDGEVRTPFNCTAEGIFTCGLTLAARLPPMGLTPVATGLTFFLPATLGLPYWERDCSQHLFLLVV